MTERLTEDVLYELLETGAEEGAYVEALYRGPRRGDPDYDADTLYRTQREAHVTVAELAGALIAARSAQRHYEGAIDEAIEALGEYGSPGSSLAQGIRELTQGIRELSKIHVLSVDDWTGLYVDGELRTEGHSLSEYDWIQLLRALGHEATSAYREDVERVCPDGYMPERLADVPARE